MSPVTGIVAEFNPLHNGHRLMMEEARSRLGGAPCVVILSSNFTQRGEPALCDKWTRAKMALRCGADLVIELPFFFACAAAPDFSAAAVDLPARTRLATHIAFGMEDAAHDIEPILDTLLHEPAPYRQRMKEELKRGASYPKAAANALEFLLPGAGTFASFPNNLLALSYLLRIRKRGYPLLPLPLPRHGEEHGALTLSPHASAGALRAALRQGAGIGDGSPLIGTMPSFSLELLREAEEAGRLCRSAKKLWPMLQALLLRSTPDGLRPMDGMDEGMEHLLLEHWRNAMSLDDFVGRCVSARYTRGHIRRRLIHLLAGVDRETACALRSAGVPYARVLGFTARGRELLRAHRKDTALPFVTRLAAARGSLEQSLAGLEFRASALYELLLPRPSLHREERQRPVIGYPGDSQDANPAFAPFTLNGGLHAR